jgi:hypothetical protein
MKMKKTQPIKLTPEQAEAFMKVLQEMESANQPQVIQDSTGEEITVDKTVTSQLGLDPRDNWTQNISEDAEYTPKETIGTIMDLGEVYDKTTGPNRMIEFLKDSKYTRKVAAIMAPITATSAIDAYMDPAHAFYYRNALIDLFNTRAAMVFEIYLSAIYEEMTGKDLTKVCYPRTKGFIPYRFDWIIRLETYCNNGFGSLNGNMYSIYADAILSEILSCDRCAITEENAKEYYCEAVMKLSAVLMAVADSAQLYITLGAIPSRNPENIGILPGYKFDFDRPIRYQSDNTEYEVIRKIYVINKDSDLYRSEE